MDLRLSKPDVFKLLIFISKLPMTEVAASLAVGSSLLVALQNRVAVDVVGAFSDFVFFRFLLFLFSARCSKTIVLGLLVF